MLKRIPSIISPRLMYLMMCMGHGDELALVDMDFPVYTFSRRVIRMDGVKISSLLEAILPFFPLDTFVDKPVSTMAPVEESKQEEPEFFRETKEIISRYHRPFTDFEYVERFKFYEKTKESFAVVVTGEGDGNLILRKGVVFTQEET